MTITYPERKRVCDTLWPQKGRACTCSPRRVPLLPQVRDTFGPEWGDGEVRITPENPAKIRVPEYLRTLGQHRFVLSPRGNGLDAHRTWEALMVGTGLPLDGLLMAS